MLSLLARAVWQPRIARESAVRGAAPIDHLERIRLGGALQSVLLRGQDIHRPVLLYLHGGPGDAFFPTARSHLTELEELFVVASWAQRGCVGSYRRGLSAASMTVDRLVDDAIELIEWLRDRFGVERVYVLGGSWGTVLGAVLAARRPDLLHAYIGKAQVVSHPEADEHAIRFVLDEADRRGHRRVRSRFEKLHPPLRPAQVAQLGIRVARYGGYGSPSHGVPGGAIAPLVSPDYSLLDLAHWLTHPFFGAVHLVGGTAELDLRREVQRIDVPVYVIQGALDVMAPVHLVESWLDELDTPRGKRLFAFEGVGHNPFAEVPERAFGVIRDTVLAETQ